MGWHFVDNILMLGGGIGWRLYDEENKTGDLLRLQQRRSTDWEKRAIRVTAQQAPQGRSQGLRVVKCLDKEEPTFNTLLHSLINEA